MPSFEIPDGPANVKLTPGATPQDPLTGNAVYGVTNKSPGAITGRIGVQVTGDTKSEWFIVEGERERPFAPGETQTVNVSIKVPSDAPAGEHKFRLRVLAVNDPDNDHMESPIGTVTVTPPDKPAEGGFPWWIVVAAVAALAVVVVLITAFVWPGFLLKDGPDPTPTPTPTVSPTSTATPLPPFSEAALKDKPREFVEGFLGALGYTPKARAADIPTGLVPGHVISATLSTAAGDAPNTVIVLYDPGVSLPNFVGSTPAAAAGLASGKVSLSYCKPADFIGPPTGRITGQSPTYPQRVAKNSGVRLTLPTNENIPICLGRFIGGAATNVAIDVLKAQGVDFAEKYKAKADQ
ncbi:COG1470 family protein [Sphingomonas sp. DT-204]|uniref:COG1470 family protein n=1 Tax=Sphingomonas sp. DT-204 TaxID=3396166 RepID=UPI003F1B7A90